MKEYDAVRYIFGTLWRIKAVEILEDGNYNVNAKLKHSSKEAACESVIGRRRRGGRSDCCFEQTANVDEANGARRLQSRTRQTGAEKTG